MSLIKFVLCIIWQKLQLVHKYKINVEYQKIERKKFVNIFPNVSLSQPSKYKNKLTYFIHQNVKQKCLFIKVYFKNHIYYYRIRYPWVMNPKDIISNVIVIYYNKL